MSHNGSITTSHPLFFPGTASYAGLSTQKLGAALGLAVGSSPVGLLDGSLDGAADGAEVGIYSLHAQQAS